MDRTEPATVISTFRVSEGEDQEFSALSRVHGSTLREQGFVTETPAPVIRGREASGASYFVEIFEWRGAAAVRTAHELPAVMAIREPMGALCEARDGEPPVEFPHVEPVRLDP